MKKLIILIIIIGGIAFYYTNTIKPAMEQNELIQTAIKLGNSDAANKIEGLLKDAYQISKDIDYDELKQIYKESPVEENIIRLVQQLGTVSKDAQDGKYDDIMNQLKAAVENIDKDSFLYEFVMDKIKDQN